MIVLDEDLRDPALRAKLDAWWPGRVIVVTEPPVGAGRGTEDPHLLRFLQAAPGCVFVTVNAGHFYDRLDGDPNFCIIELQLGTGSDNADLVYETVRALLQAAPFNTARKRNGLVIRANRQEASYYRRRADSASRKGRVRFR